MHFSPFERAERTDLISLWFAVMLKFMLPMECCTRRRKKLLFYLLMSWNLEVGTSRYILVLPGL